MDPIAKTILLAIPVTFIGMLVAGATNRIVIYFDKKDFAISFAPIALFFVGLILVEIYQEGDKSVDFGNLSILQGVIWYATLASAAGCFLWSIRLSILHNRNVVLGLFVGVFKVLCAALGVWAMLGSFKSAISSQSTLRQAVLAGMLLSGLAWLGRRLINGEQVYLAKGWELPSANEPSVAGN